VLLWAYRGAGPRQACMMTCRPWQSGCSVASGCSVVFCPCRKPDYVSALEAVTQLVIPAHILAQSLVTLLCFAATLAGSRSVSAVISGGCHSAAILAHMLAHILVTRLCSPATPAGSRSVPAVSSGGCHSAAMAPHILAHTFLMLLCSPATFAGSRSVSAVSSRKTATQLPFQLTSWLTLS
jgi:F0F1-type ATP synthase assembly protein I